MLKLGDIKGHDEIVARLRAGVRDNTLARAYLFYGPEGVGKFSAAKALARAANCEQLGAPSNRIDGQAPVRTEECGVCSACRRIEAGNYPDVHIIDQGYTAEIKIEDVRALQQEICLMAYEARRKVFIINDSHNLNPVAANAMLKTLEDTPGQSLIILVTDKPRVLLDTVVSRCRRENFRPLDQAGFSEQLAGLGFDAPTRGYLAYFCEGRLGLAMRLKGSDILGEKNALIDRFLGGRLEDSEIKREELRKGLVIIAGWFRDVYMTKLGLENAINADRRRDLEQCAARYGFGDIERIFGTISASLGHLEQNVNIKLLTANLQISLKG